MPATEITNLQVPGIYRRFATAIGPALWQGVAAQQRAATVVNPFLDQHLREEHAIAFQLEQMRILHETFGSIPFERCSDASIYPAIVFAAQVLEVLRTSSHKDVRSFVKRVRTALKNPENMRGLSLELTAATHFASRGHHASWRRTKSEGSFDLLISGLGPNGLEVECKSISENKGRRIHRSDAVLFASELWQAARHVVQGLQTGLAVVLTVPNRLPGLAEDRQLLIRAVVSQIIQCSGVDLPGGASVRMASFDPSLLKSAHSKGPAEVREVVGSITGTDNREAAVFETPYGGWLAFVMQSVLDDDLLTQLFATLDDSAGRQFSGTRASLFWVGLQGVSPRQLVSLHEHDSDAMQQPTSLRRRVSDFLHPAPQHVVGVVFCSHSQLDDTVSGRLESSGSSYFFLKDTGRFWHETFRGPLQARPQ